MLVSGFAFWITRKQEVGRLRGAAFVLATNHKRRQRIDADFPSSARRHEVYRSHQEALGGSRNGQGSTSARRQGHHQQVDGKESSCVREVPAYHPSRWSARRTCGRLSRRFSGLVGPALAGWWHPAKLNIMNGVSTSMASSLSAGLLRPGLRARLPHQAVADIIAIRRLPGMKIRTSPSSLSHA